MTKLSLKQCLMRRVCLLIPLCAGGLVVALGSGLQADQTGESRSWETLHGEVRRGELVPLEQVLDWLEAHYHGKVLEVEVERDDGIVEYEIRMLGPQGQIVEFEFDAANGELMEIEGANINAMQR